MTSIASPRNPRLKALRRLRTARGRSESGCFFAEGEDLLAAAAQAGRDPVEGYRLAGSAIGGPSFHDLPADVLGELSTLGSGTRAIGVYEQRWQRAPAEGVCVYLHGVADPGNVGTVLRGALAFGAATVALGPGCADPHSPKAVRASMGAIFAVGLARVEDPSELPGARLALVASAGEPLWSLPRELAAGALTLLVGAEREGLPAELVAACERVVRIPIEVESLNAAMAATVALYELARARACEPQGGRPSRVRAS